MCKAILFTYFDEYGNSTPLGELSERILDFDSICLKFDEEMKEKIEFECMKAAKEYHKKFGNKYGDLF